MRGNNAAQYLPLVQALTEGKTIQLNLGDSEKPVWSDFTDAQNISFALEPHAYRIKPEVYTSLPSRRYLFRGIDDQQCNIGILSQRGDRDDDRRIANVESFNSFRGWIDKDWTTFSVEAEPKK